MIERLKSLLHSLSHFSLSAQIKINNRVISPPLTFLILLFGLGCLLRSTFRRIYMRLVFPILRRLFQGLRRKSSLLARQKGDTFVLIYGACTKLGKLTAKVFASYNYSLVLVDRDLSKLQKLQGELFQVFTDLNENRVRLVQVDFSTQRDSTAIEHALHRAVLQRDPWAPVPSDPVLEVESESDKELEPSLREQIRKQKLQETEARHSLPVPKVNVFVDCMSVLPEHKTLTDKLCHEVQFDQLFNYLGNTTLGFSVIFNYFTRIHAHLQQPACLISFKPKVILPWERDGNPLALRLGNMIVRPLSYHKNMDRVDLFAMAQQAYQKKLMKSVHLHYPQMKAFTV